MTDEFIKVTHNHNVQYYKVDSIIYHSGAGGRSHYPLGPTPKPTFFQNDNFYGFSAIKLTDDDINGAFYSNNGKAVSGSDFSMNQKKGSSADSATSPRVPVLASVDATYSYVHLEAYSLYQSYCL